MSNLAQRIGQEFKNLRDNELSLKANNSAVHKNTEHIIPAVSDLDIGSTTNRFRAIYVDEAYLSTNTLYIGDTPILGTEADNIIIKSDPDQSILIKTSGIGSTQLQSENEVSLSTNNINADVKLQALGTNSKIRLAGAGGIELTSATTAQNDFTISGNLTVSGNATINGSNFVVNTQTVSTADNIIVLNDGEVGTGVTAGKAGIQIDRGDAASFQLVFDETTDKFIIGSVGGTFETIATREYVDARSTAIETSISNLNSLIDYPSATLTALVI